MVRLLATFAGISGPFYVVFARKELGISVEVMALFMILSTGVSLLGGLVWAPIANRAPRRTLVVLSAALQLAVPAYALLAVLLGAALPAGFAPYVVAPVFLLGGLATGASIMFNDTTLLSIAPPGERSTYFGFLNTLVGVASFTLPLGGLLLEWYGYLPLFALSTLLALLSLFAGLHVGAAPPVRAERRMPLVKSKVQSLKSKVGLLLDFRL